MSKSKIRIIIKYLIVLILSLGVLSFPFLIVGIEINCTGQDVFPVYYASPLIYKSTSLATSLAYDYYILGLVVDCIIWMIFFLILEYALKKIILDRGNKLINIIFKGIIVLFLVISILSLKFALTSAGSSIEWSINLNNKANLWGMTCKGKLIFFR